MKVVIISAGSATRLGDYTKELPKGLLDINGKSILERQILLFKKFEISDITIITGPHSEKYNFTDVSYVHDDEYQEHDVLGSLMASRKLLNDDLIISYSDILFDENIFKPILNCQEDIGVAVDLEWEESYKNRTLHPKEQADSVLIQNDKIVKIKKNISTLKENEVGEFIGLMKLSKKGAYVFLQKYKKLEKSHKGAFHEAASLKKAYLTDMLQELIDSKIKVTPIIIKGNWCEVDTYQDLESARKKFK